jgi:large conductance mechanosensitive channel
MTMDSTNKTSAFDVKGKSLSLFGEFKKFALKGNVIDMAIGVIIGTAFGAIIKSLVEDIIMPFIGVILPGDKGYEGWVLELGEAVVPYGKFLGATLNFLIIAAVLFLFVVKFLGWLMKTKKVEAAAPPAPTKDQQLLEEIRDLLKQRGA